MGYDGNNTSRFSKKDLAYDRMNSGRDQLNETDFGRLLLEKWDEALDQIEASDNPEFPRFCDDSTILNAALDLLEKGKTQKEVCKIFSTFLDNMVFGYIDVLKEQSKGPRGTPVPKGLADEVRHTFMSQERRFAFNLSTGWSARAQRKEEEKSLSDEVKTKIKKSLS